MKNFLTIIFLLSNCLTADAQNIKANLVNSSLSNEYLLIKDYMEADFKSFPYSKYPQSSIKRAAYSSEQVFLEKVLDGKISLAAYNKFVKANGMDTTQIVNQKLKKNYFLVAIGIDSLGFKHVMVDENNNHDFSDDKEHVFDLNKPTKQNVEAKVYIDYFDGYNVQEGWVNLTITAPSFKTYAHENDKRLGITVFKTFPNKSGTIKVGAADFKITIGRYNSLNKRSQYLVEITKTDQSKNIYNNIIYQNTDTLFFGEDGYKIRKIENNNIQLYFVGKTLKSTGDLFTQAPQIKGKDIISQRSFSLKDHIGKYVVIDFWGSWCIPCVNSLPTLSKFNKDYGDKVVLVSVAFDKMADLAKAKALIKQHEMTWIQLLDARDVDENNIVDDYKVHEFPTSILIDPQGKVIYRDVAESGFKNLIKHLNTLKINGE